MPGQVIGTVNVQVGQPTSPRATTITYGGRNSLKSATDLSLADVEDGDVIVYAANTNSFIVKPPSEITPSLNAGFF
tara:strand:+ start:112 stop:339 length:228 start_codon:yes stop_codon:yes gene_type:complete